MDLKSTSAIQNFILIKAIHSDFNSIDIQKFIPWKRNSRRNIIPVEHWFHTIYKVFSWVCCVVRKNKLLKNTKKMIVRVEQRRFNWYASIGWLDSGRWFLLSHAYWTVDFSCWHIDRWHMASGMVLSTAFWTLQQIICKDSKKENGEWNTK